MPALAPQLINAAQSLINQSLAPGEISIPLSKNWLARYLKQQPHIQRIKQKTEELDCTACKEITIYNAYFTAFRYVVDKHGIPSRDIYSIDKTGFHISIEGNQWIITLDIVHRHYSLSDINRDYIISVEYIVGDSEVID